VGDGTGGMDTTGSGVFGDGGATGIVGSFETVSFDTVETVGIAGVVGNGGGSISAAGLLSELADEVGVTTGTDVG
jgi:hypothetical protein